MKEARLADVLPSRAPGQSNTENGRNMDMECLYCHQKGLSKKKCRLRTGKEHLRKTFRRSSCRDGGNGRKTDVKVTKLTKTATRKNHGNENSNHNSHKKTGKQ